MAKQAVNIGTTANDGTGDPLRTAFDKINDNFDELYQSLGDGSDLSLTIDSDGNVDISADLTVDTNVFHVDSTSNQVGIGTVSPSEHLHIKDSTAADFTTIRIEGLTAAANDPIGALEFYNTTSAPSAEVAGFIKMQAASGGRRQYEMLFGTGNTANASTKMVINKDGNVGIGTSSPSYNLSIEDTTDAILHLKGSDLGRVYFGDAASDNVGRIQYYHVDNSMQFYANGSERMRILSSGGLTFNGDTAAANALDDYEEGTFTPVFADAATGGNTASPTDANGSYVKVGSMVTISLQLQNTDLTGMTGTNTAYIRNLPFSAKNLTGAIKFQGVPRINIFTANANNMHTTVELGDNTNYMLFLESLTNSGNAVNATVNQFANGSDIFLTMTYFAD